MTFGAVYPHFDPTSIIAGDFPLAARKITVASGQNASGSPLQPGVVLGQQNASGFSAAYAAQGGNTGNATLAFGTPATLPNAKAGVYKVVFSSATAFQVFDPLGDEIGTGVNGTAFADQIKFTTTAGGTPMVAGDTLLVTLTAQMFTAAQAANGGNTGNGALALAAAPVLAYASQGAYAVNMTSPTTFEVTDPFGNPVGAGTVGVAFANQIAFTLNAGGVAFTASDGFTVTVSATDQYVASVATASDGSQNPACILAEWIDTSGGAITCDAYFTGEFAYEELTVDASWSMATLNQAFAAKGQSIFLRSVGQAA